MITSLAVAVSARAQTAPSANAGATHDIVMRASVPPSCRITNTASQISLTGTTDAGQTVNTTLSGSGGFTVDCNTTYAINLARTGIYATQPGRATASPSQSKQGSAFASAEPAAAAHAPAPPPQAVLEESRDLDVLVRVAGREGPIESHCVMAALGSPYVCHAIAGPEDARVPLPRASASLIVTGALAQPVTGGGAVASDAEPLQVVRTAVQVSPDTTPLSQAAVIGVARERANRVRVGERLTVSLSARY